MRPEIAARIAQIRRGEVPDGYRRAKAGIIPADWKSEPLQAVCEINPKRNGAAPPEVSFIAMSDTDEHGRILCQRLVPYDSVSQGYTPFLRGDVLVAKITPCFENGKGAYTETLETQCGFGSTEFHVLRCRPGMSGKYLFFHTQSDAFRNKLKTEMTGTAGQKRVQTASLAAYRVAFPPLDEQRKIADVLSAQDNVIALKERLIAEKSRQKRYLMQQFLTGKRRLPGFDGPWKTAQFQDVFHFVPNNTCSRAFMTDSGGEIRNVHYGDVLIKYHSIIDCGAKDLPFLTSDAKINPSMFLKNGDMIIADTAEDLTAGKAAEIINIGTQKVVSGLHTMACRPAPNLFAPKWLGYYMDSAAYHNQLIPLIRGAKVSSISKREIMNTMIAIPPIEEQAAIAEILSAADREIELLRRSLALERRRKTALAQLLLTGIVRLS